MPFKYHEKPKHYTLRKSGRHSELKSCSIECSELPWLSASAGVSILNSCLLVPRGAPTSISTFSSFYIRSTPERTGKSPRLEPNQERQSFAHRTINMCYNHVVPQNFGSHAAFEKPWAGFQQTDAEAGNSAVGIKGVGSGQSYTLSELGSYPTWSGS